MRSEVQALVWDAFGQAELELGAPIVERQLVKFCPRIAGNSEVKANADGGIVRECGREERC
jgi:hypothetical protein